jgi:RND family efflux transporter MFP subunit
MFVSILNYLERTTAVNDRFPRLISRLIPASLLFLLPAMALISGCGQAHQEQEKKVPEVIVTTPVTAQVTDYQDFTGRLDGIKTVEVRARVSGFVMAAPFKEGDLVHEGDLLFQIDRRTYQATLNQTEANLKLAETDRSLQERNATRARRLAGSNSVGAEEYETMIATFEKSKATVGSMEAARDMAKLYLDYTQVTAPVTGRVSRRFVDPGNLVVQDSTLLTTIVSDSQLYAYFDVDERAYLDLLGAASPGQGSWFAGLKFPVVMRLANEEEFTRTGTVNFIDNRVSATTGTIRMRGLFENPLGALKAGLFVRIRLPIGNPYQAVLIADEALQSDQGRKYVYVVNDGNEVVYRPVTIGQEIQGMAVIKKGLAEGERVILSGMQRVRPGTPVQVKMQKPPKAPESPLARLLTSSRKEGEAENKRRPGEKARTSGPARAES